jgi:hypothetical protein
LTVDEYLADKKPEAVELFHRFAALVEACGPSEVAPRKSIVYWKRKRIWAGAFCNGKKLELNIDLLREVDHPRNLAVIPHTKRVLTHRACAHTSDADHRGRAARRLDRRHASRVVRRGWARHAHEPGVTVAARAAIRRRAPHLNRR